MADDLLTTPQVAERVGVTVRSLDYWIREGMISLEHPPAGSGNYARWTEEEVQTLRYCLGWLRRADGIRADWRDGKLWAEKLPRR